MNLKEELTLMLIYVSSWEERGLMPKNYQEMYTNSPTDEVRIVRARIGYGYEVLQSLMDNEITHFMSNPSKEETLSLTDKGEELAKELLKKYHLIDE